MKKQSVEDHILTWLKTSLPSVAGAITRETDLIGDLDLDSMSMVSLIFSLDEAFHVGTDQMGDLVASCRTVGDLIAATEQLRHERV
ncbi:MAG: acyl carrier protein [Alphaproteobacteria bacterium]|jgi:acyl carrier protein|nr:acyl carrier protein [Alphaproteobacteria bacterium]